MLTIDTTSYLIITLSFLVWVISAVRGISLYSYFWQLKEYRLDRMQEFMSSVRGRSMFFSIHNSVRLILIIIIAAFLWDKESEYLPTIIIAALLVLGLLSFARILWDYKNHSLYRPKFTFRMYLVVLSIIVTEGIIWWIYRYDPIVVLLLEVLRPLTVSVFIMLVGLPFFVLKKHIIHKATKKRKLYKELKVIGVTGSYGKTSTKEFLFKILESKFKVVKTPKHINVDIGIAQTLLKNVTGDEDIFIVEMGAYKKGEIKSSCNIVKPNIGILTGINEQHICFFGNIENTIKAKAELLASLPKNGLAIVNADNYHVTKALEHNNAENIIRYGLNMEHEIKASNIVQKEKVLKFVVHRNHKRADFEVPVFGKHYVQNLLACIACALELGLTLAEIAEAARSCEVPEGSLKIFEGRKESKVLDDSYNANPDGFAAALSTLKVLKPKRVILVTPGMMELGVHNNEIHRRIGQQIAETCDFVFITSQDNYSTLNSSIKEVSKKVVVSFESDHQELIKKINKCLKKGDLILFENRVPQVVIDYFRK